MQFFGWMFLADTSQNEDLCLENASHEAPSMAGSIFHN